MGTSPLNSVLDAAAARFIAAAKAELTAAGSLPPSACGFLMGCAAKASEDQMELRGLAEAMFQSGLLSALMNEISSSHPPIAWDA